MKEARIEDDLVDQLCDLNYIYRKDIKDRKSLESNFRAKFNELNSVNLTDNEFSRLLETIVTNDVFKASKLLREKNYFEREDGTPLYYHLVNTKDWCKNTYEVAKQVRINTDYAHHVYDVVLLINGVPVVQIELKTLHINPRRAMEQIVEYKNDAGNGYGRTIMCFLQLFIVSNLIKTWYFANNNNNHFTFNAEERFLPLYQYANRANKKIINLHDFTKTFLQKCTLGEMISRYMVLVESEHRLIMMRPYQIYAVESIVDSIKQNCGNGYVWHTTGSGKTLTSFKASTLLKDNPAIEKCLFVVDRKDLDRQTRDEFNRFQENCVEQNTSTYNLVERLLSDSHSNKVIVTTIQKLGLALGNTKKHNYKKQLAPLQDKRIVFIFDECHRSQFGDNHEAIKEFFPKAQLFGFTGTPIFEENSIYKEIDGTQASYKTTETIFQHQLHEYTITDAIEDNNVLRFRVDYYRPEGKRMSQGKFAKQAIVESIYKEHDTATNSRRFNALLATGSINEAIEYYDLFKAKQEKAIEEGFEPLNIACVFSPPSRGNQDIKQIQEDLPQEKFDNNHEPEKKTKALKTIIADYNEKYSTNHNIDDFDAYYQDVQKRIKDQQYTKQDLSRDKKIDVMIVVDMLLTGFDSKYLNTLYVDKNLKHHGLIQAFSRTNRILNASKPYGNIIDFRQQQKKVEKAVTMFSGEETTEEKAKQIWLVDPAPVVIKKLTGEVSELGKFMKSKGLENKPEDVHKLKGDAARIKFVELFREIQQTKTQLDQYTNLEQEQKDEIEKLLPADELQGFKGAYLETAERLKSEIGKDDDDKSKIDQLDFKFVLFASDIIDHDYIMKLIAELLNKEPSQQKMSRKQLIDLIRSDAKFINDRDDIEEYIHSLKAGKGFTEKQIRDDYETFRDEKHKRNIIEMAQKHNLQNENLEIFISDILKRMIFDDGQFTKLLMPLGLGWKERSKLKLSLMEDLKPLLLKRSSGREISGLDVYG